MSDDLTPVAFENLLIVRPRFLGDIILATGLASAAKAERPGARVSFLVESAFADALSGHPDIDEVLTFDAARKNNLPYLWRFVRALRAKRFDTVLDLFGNPRTAQWTFLSGASVRVGYRLRGRTWAYNRIAFPSTPHLLDEELGLTQVKHEDLSHRLARRRPVTEAYLDQWRALGYDAPHPYRTYLQVSGAEFGAADGMLSSRGWDGGDDLVVLCPGASYPAKRWEVGRFLELAKRLSSRGLQAVFVLGPKDLDLLPVLETELPPRSLVISRPSLRELLALVASARLLVSNDAGPMHVGPAVGTPTVGIFGPGEPEIWFPYTSPHHAAYREVDCSHCGLDICDRMDCMRALTVDDVLQCCDRSLAEEESPGPPEGPSRASSPPE